MPKAVVVLTPEHFDLTTLPKTEEEEGGFVELRRLSYGEKLAKDAEAMKMKFKMDQLSGGDSSGVDAEISVISEYATYLEFAKCVVNHNLQDEQGKTLDLKKPEGIKKLDPRVGDEISRLIGQLNDFEREAKSSKVDAQGK